MNGHGRETGRRLSIPSVPAPGPRRLGPADRGPGKRRKGPRRSCKVASLEMGAWEAEKRQSAAHYRCMAIPKRKSPEHRTPCGCPSIPHHSRFDGTFFTELNQCYKLLPTDGNSEGSN